MVVVGDRLATDIMFGNVNNMSTIYVKPFKTNWNDHIDFKLKSILGIE